MTSVEILPGEMRLWTDLGNDRRPAAGGSVLTTLLEQVGRDGSVLVAGPHADDVLALLDGATVLVRSLADAEVIAERHPGLRVVCGDLAELSGTFDLVVALDGVERVASNDRPFSPWTERLSTLVDRVAEGGRLLLTVDNDASLLALADARPLAERRDTGDWEPPVSTDLSRPADPLAVRSVLTTLGLEGVLYAAFWQQTAPTVLVDPASLSDDVRIRSTVSAGADALAPYTLLFDPVSPALASLHTADAGRAASGWVVVDGRGAPALELPAAILAGRAGSRTVLGTDDLMDPPGRATVAEAAVERAQREDLAGLRGLMRDYLAWVAKEGRSERPDEVILTESGFTAPETPTPDGDPVATSVLWLARRLLAPDMRRIWPPHLDEAGVARSLAAMAGLDLDQAQLDGAAAALSGLALVTDDVTTLRALNDQLREEIVAARGEAEALGVRMSLFERLLERRMADLTAAESRAAEADERARRAEDDLARINGSVPRRAARALKDPKLVARKVRDRLRDR